MNLMSMLVGFIGILVAVNFSTPGSIFIVLGFIYFMLNEAANEI